MKSDTALTKLLTASCWPSAYGSVETHSYGKEVQNLEYSMWKHYTVVFSFEKTESRKKTLFIYGNWYCGLLFCHLKSWMNADTSTPSLELENLVKCHTSSSQIHDKWFRYLIDMTDVIISGVQKAWRLIANVLTNYSPYSLVVLCASLWRPFLSFWWQMLACPRRRYLHPHRHRCRHQVSPWVS